MCGRSLQRLSNFHLERGRLAVVGVAAWFLTLLVPAFAQAATVATYQFGPGWATFGLALPQGAATADVQVGTLPTQTDVKTVWPDGSIRFAVVTANIPSAGSYPIIGGGASAPGLFTPVWPAASVTFVVGGATYVATLPSFNGTDSWLSAGSLVREARVVVVPRAGELLHPMLQVLFDVRSYVGGGHRVDVTVQNARDIPTANLVTYDVTVSIEGTTFSRPAVTQNWGTRWRKTFAAGGFTEADVTPDIEPFIAANAVPRFLPSVTNMVYESQGAAFDILQFGTMSPGMGAPGGRPELAPYPYWTAQYLVHRTSNLRQYMLANGNLAGSWSGYIMEPDGVSLLRLDRHPNYWLDVRSPSPDGPANGFAGAGNRVDATHVPSLSYVPYLVTGDRYYLDTLKVWANTILLQTYTGSAHSFGTDTHVDSNRQGALGLLAPHSNEPRGFGWGLRELVDAAVATPDSDPDKSYFWTRVQNNLSWLADYAVTPGGGFLNPPFWDFDPGTGHVGYFSVSMWQNSYLTWAVDHASRLGFGPTAAFRARSVAAMVKLLTSAPDLPPEYGASSYYPRIGTFVNGVHTPFQTMREYFVANYIGPADLYDGLSTTIPREPGPILGYYDSDYRMLLLMGVRDHAPGADAALQWLMDYRSQGQGVLEDINWRSGYALAPFDDEELPDSPVIGAVPANPTIPNSPNGATYEYTVTAFSGLDGTLPTTCSPASGFLFPVGMTIVTCAATDHLGHESSKSFTVTVTSGAPGGGGGGDDGGGGGDVTTLTIVQPEPWQVVEAEGPWGIVLDYDPPVWHMGFASGITSCNLPPGSTFPLGVTRLFCTASVNGNVATVFTDVMIIDTTKPTVTVSSPVSGVYLMGQRVPIAFSCADNASGIKRCDGDAPDGGTLDTSAPGPHAFNALAIDQSDNFVQAAVPYIVLKETPLTWSTPADISYGTPLSALQLNAHTSVPGTFYYSPPAGTILSPGVSQELWVTFLPNDSNNYAPAAGMVRLNVRQRIVVSAPNTAVAWTTGTAHAVTWTHNLGTGTPFNIDVSYNGGASWTSVAAGVPANTPTTGTYSWTVSGPAAGQARIRVSRTTDPLSYDISDVDFSIIAGTVTVTSPNGSGTLRIGDPRPITFTHNLGAGQPVTIEITRDGGSTWGLIAVTNTTAATSSSYAWVVTGPTTTRARIRVTSNATVSDVSDVDFGITGPTITVTSPNGAGTVRIGDPQTITFTHNLGVGQLINLDVSLDGGATWTPIGTTTTTSTTSGSYVWVVSSAATTRGRVRASWAANATVYDSSDVNFTISDTLSATGKK